MFIGRWFRMCARRSLGAAVSAALVFCGGLEARAQYRLAVGDVLELSILGPAEMRHTIPIDISGEASFPLIGEIQAAGLTLAELRATVQEALKRQVYRGRSPNGPDALQFVEREDVFLRVATYRPVYVGGNIARPGEIPYRPGLTVRQAVTVAGGYGALHPASRGDLVDSIALRNQLDRTAVALVKERARVWRLENALGRKTTLDQTRLPPVGTEVISQAVRLEEEYLSTHLKDYENQRTYLATAIEHAEARFAALSNQSKSEEEGAKLDAADVVRVMELFQKGMVPITRVTEVRRASLLGASRALQTSVAAENAKKDREELKSRLQRLEDTRRIELLRELEDAQHRMETLRIQLEGEKERLLLTGTGAQAVTGLPTKTRIVIQRQNGKTQETLVATEQTELFPGDVVEVRVVLEQEETSVASEPFRPKLPSMVSHDIIQRLPLVQ